jgi:hypothetical protein
LPELAKMVRRNRKTVYGWIATGEIGEADGLFVLQVASLAVNAEGCLYRYDEYSEGILLCTTRMGERMGGFPVHYTIGRRKG